MSGKRTVRVKRKVSTPSGASLTLEAVEALIEKRIAPLQKKLTEYDEDLDTLGVILSDFESSIRLASPDAGSTKTRLDELLSNLEASLVNLSIYRQGKYAQNIIRVRNPDEAEELNVILQQIVADGAARMGVPEAILGLRRGRQPPARPRRDPGGISEDEDLIENVSEYEDEEETWGEDDT